MWPLAASLIGLIGLLAADDAIQRRPLRHTWWASLALIAGVSALLAASILVGKLIA